METGDRLAELQAKKLELEIKELERPFFKKASFLSIIVPLFAALVTGLVGYVGNIQLQELRDQRKHLEETTRQLLTDQQHLTSSLITGIQDYLAYLSRFEKYTDSPDALFTKSALVSAKQNFDAFLISQERSVSLSRGFADKYQDLLGKEKAKEMIARCDSATILIENVRTQVDKEMGRVIRELHK